MIIRFLFILAIIFISILSCQKFLAYPRIFLLKKRIKNNPFIGIRQPDNSYDYKLAGYTMIYRIKESPTGVKTVEWLSLKHRLTFFERKTKNIERKLNKFFLYQRWTILFHPLVATVLIVSMIVFYFGIKENSLKQIERFKWVASQITGVSPESIEYSGSGWFKIFGQRRALDRKTEPVTISFNPLNWLFFSDTVNVSRWNEETKNYITYPVTVNDRGDIWLQKKDSQIHGRMSGDKIIWDEPTGTRRVSGHRTTTEDSKIKVIDER